MKKIILAYTALGFAILGTAYGAAQGKVEASGLTAAETKPIYLTKGQSFIICNAADSNTGNAIEAVQNLNQRLLKGQETLASGDGKVIVQAPYHISAPAITGYSRSIADIACVTVTKE
jgi:hypothetical protein